MLDTEKAETLAGVTLESWPRAEPRSKPAQARPFNELSGFALKVFFASWALFALVVLLAFGGKLDVLFNLGVVFAFGAMFFGVPVVLLRIHRKDWKRPETYVDTPNGRMSQTTAVMQIVMVPLILSVGMALIGYFATHP